MTEVDRFEWGEVGAGSNLPWAGGKTNNPRPSTVLFPFMRFITYMHLHGDWQVETDRLPPPRLLCCETRETNTLCQPTRKPGSLRPQTTTKEERFQEAVRAMTAAMPEDQVLQWITAQTGSLRGKRRWLRGP